MKPRREKQPTRLVAAPEYMIPVSFHREIGRIMVYWAYFENGVRRVLWRTLGVDQKIGRLAVRDPRMDARIEMIVDLVHLKKLKVDEARIKLMISRSNEILGLRDLLAHGTWFRGTDGWLVQMISGSYPKGTLSEHRKRRVAPEGINVDLDGLRTITDAIEMLIQMIQEIADEILPQLPKLPETHP